MSEPCEELGARAGTDPSEATPTPRARVTGRDRTIARFVARWGPVTQPQIARRADMSRMPSFRRLQVLRDAGYLHYERPLDDLPGVFGATSRGVELAGGVNEVAGPPASYALWPHLAAVDEAIDAELAGLSTATRLEALADPELRGILPHTTGGALVPPRAILLDPRGPLAVYAVMRPVAGAVGVVDELVALALESYRQLAPGVRRRILVSSELADAPGVAAAREAGAEVVPLDPAAVGRSRE